MRVSFSAMSKAVELSVAGQRCRVVSSASPEELQVLTDMVESKLAMVLKPGRPVTTQAMILAAIALANDVVEQRQRADTVTAKASTTLQGLLQRVDQALAVKQELAPQKRVRRKRSEQQQHAEQQRPATAARAHNQQSDDSDQP